MFNHIFQMNKKIIVYMLFIYSLFFSISKVYAESITEHYAYASREFYTDRLIDAQKDFYDSMSEDVQICFSVEPILNYDFYSSNYLFKSHTITLNKKELVNYKYTYDRIKSKLFSEFNFSSTCQNLVATFLLKLIEKYNYPLRLHTYYVYNEYTSLSSRLYILRVSNSEIETFYHDAIYNTKCPVGYFFNNAYCRPLELEDGDRASKKCISLSGEKIKQNYLTDDAGLLTRNNNLYYYNTYLECSTEENCFTVPYSCSVEFYEQESFSNVHQDICSKYYFQVIAQDHKNPYGDKIPLEISQVDERCLVDLVDSEPVYDPFGFDASCIHKDTKTQYDLKGFDCNGVHKETSTNYDKNGYDREGYDQFGYDEDGFDRAGMNADTGTDKDSEGYDKDGYDEEGNDKNGFNEEGINKDTGTDRDPFDFDRWGKDREGYNREGYNDAGYNREGYDQTGHNSDGYDENGVNKDGYSESNKAILDELVEIKDSVTIDKDELSTSMSERSFQFCSENGNCESMWTSLYESRGGFSGVLNGHFDTLKNSQIFNTVLSTESLSEFNGGTVPVYDFDFNWGQNMDFGTYKLDFSNAGGFDILMICRIFLMLAASFAALRIVL